MHDYSVVFHMFPSLLLCSLTSVSQTHSILSRCPIFISFLSPSYPFISLLSDSLSLSAEAHQGKQMLWLLFMFPLGLAFIQIIHRPCTVQTISLTGLLWQLSQPYPRTLRLYHRRCKRGVIGGEGGCTQADRINHGKTQ